MKPIAWMAVTAGLGLAVGILIGRTSSTQVDSENQRIAGNDRPSERQRPRDRSDRSGKPTDDVLSKLLGGRSAASLSIEDIKAIIAKNSERIPNEDPVAAARRYYEYQLFLSKLPADTLGEVFQSIVSSEGRRSGNASQVFNSWARRDWKSAMAWAESDPNGKNWIPSVISSLIATDPGGAEEMLKEHMLSGNFSDNLLYTANHNLAQTKARLGKEVFMKFLEGLTSQQQSSIGGPSVIRELPKEELGAFLDEIYDSRGKNNLSSRYLNETFSELMGSDPAAAKAWLEKMEPGQQRDNLEYSAATRLAYEGKTSESTEMLRKIMLNEPGKEKELIRKLARSGNQNSEVLAELVKSLPPEVEMTAEDYKENSGLSGWNGSSGIIEMAKTIRNPTEQAKLLSKVLDQAAQQSSRDNGGRGLNEKDLKIFEARIGTLGLTGQAAEQVAASMEKVRENVNNPPPK